MSNATIAGACPMPPTTNVTTIGHDTGSGGFRRVEKPKEDVRTWWEHDIKVDVTFCKEKSEDWMKDVAKEFVRDLNPNCSYQNPYQFKGITRTSGNVMEISISVRNSSLTPDTIKARLEQRVPSFLGSWMTHHPVTTASFDFSSEQKQEVTRYTVQDGFERV